MKAPFEYEIPCITSEQTFQSLANLTYFSYVTTSGSDFSINTLYPSEKEDNFTQCIMLNRLCICQLFARKWRRFVFPHPVRMVFRTATSLTMTVEASAVQDVRMERCIFYSLKKNTPSCYASTDCLSNSCVNFKCTNGYTNVIIIFGILAAVVVFLIPFIFSILYFSKTRSQRIVRYKLSYQKTKVPTIPVVEVPQTSVGAHYKLNV